MRFTSALALFAANPYHPDLYNHPYKTKDSPWLKPLYVLLSLATAIVLVKVVRHPK